MATSGSHGFPASRCFAGLIPFADINKLPRLTGKEMVRFLEQQGLACVRICGSHHFFDRDGTHTTVPVHGNEPLRIGTLRSILRDIDLSPVEFERFYRS